MTYEGADPVDAGIRVELELPPTDDPRWLVPGVFYGENRVEACTRLYPRFTPGRVDVSRMESDAWSFRADRCATPAVFARGGGLVTTETSPLGQSGVGFAYRDGRPALWLDFPYREEPLRYDGSETPAPPDVRTYRWQPGERVELALRAERRRLAARALGATAPRRCGRRGLGLGARRRRRSPRTGLHRWHFRPDPPRLIETAAFDRDGVGERGDRDAMHVSWVSGAPYAYALLRHGRRVGDAEYVARGRGRARPHRRQPHARPGRSGRNGRATAAGRGAGTPTTRAPTRARSPTPRCSCSAPEGAGRRPRARISTSPGAHSATTERCQPPCTSRPATAVSWDGTAGMSWIQPLVEAGHLEEAARAGAYYRRFDHWYGAPEDVDLAPTSEDGYAALQAFVALGDLETARRAADWLLTFRYSYDVAFPETTILGRYGFRTRGADQASPANQHLHAFGLMCLPELVRLGRESAKSATVASARENLACFRQFIAREDGDFGAMKGMAAERYYQTDCFGPKGMLGTLSHAWSVGALLYGCEAALELGL